MLIPGDLHQFLNLCIRGYHAYKIYGLNEELRELTNEIDRNAGIQSQRIRVIYSLNGSGSSYSIYHFFILALLRGDTNSEAVGERVNRGASQGLKRVEVYSCSQQ